MQAESGGFERIELHTARNGFVFDAYASGPADGDLVLLLHGFPQTGYAYRRQLAALGEAGYRAVAPDQRGYSARARPATVDSYVASELVGDVLAIADALDADRFHVVGHDWGSAIAWLAAGAHPGRVRTLTALSVPHPFAFARAMSGEGGSDQGQRSSYFAVFSSPDAEDLFLNDDA